MSDGDKDYKVSDRRSFTPDGNLREPAATDESGTGDPEGPEAPPEPGEVPAGTLPEIDFTTFVLSLASNALIQMGAAHEGEPELGEVNLPLARQTIDILGLLQRKTQGNLTGEEERLLDHVLYDLRMQYVRVTQQK